MWIAACRANVDLKNREGQESTPKPRDDTRAHGGPEARSSQVHSSCRSPVLNRTASSYIDARFHSLTCFSERKRTALEALKPSLLHQAVTGESGTRISQ